MATREALVLTVTVVTLVTMVTGDSCSVLGDYIMTLDQMYSSNLTGEAATRHPVESGVDEGLATCETSNSCCTNSSEKLLKEASGEVFSIYAVTIALQTIEDDVKQIRHDVRRQIERRIKAADGSKTAGLILTYLDDGLDNLNEITTAKLAHFFSVVYGADYGSNADKCLDGLDQTRKVVFERVEEVVSLYRDVLESLRRGEKILTAIKTDMEKMGRSARCEAAVLRSSLFAGLGCKQCTDTTARVPTCFHTCINVVRGCLRGLLCYTVQWESWTDEMETFDAKLRVLDEDRSSFYGDLGDVLGEELNELNEAGKWSSDCYVGPRDLEKKEELGKKSLEIDAIKTGIFSPGMKERLAKVPDAICSESSTISDVQYEVDTECWNGKEIATYTQPTPQFTLEEQKCNPEVGPSELFCDTRDLSCSAYDQYYSTSPTQAPTEGMIVDTGKSAAEQIKLTGLVAIMTMLVLQW